VSLRANEVSEAIFMEKIASSSATFGGETPRNDTVTPKADLLQNKTGGGVK